MRVNLPPFDEVWKKGFILYDVSDKNRNYISMADFRANPARAPLNTESGKIQLYSPLIKSYGYEDCQAHPMYFQPTEGVATATEQYPLALMAP